MPLYEKFMMEFLSKKWKLKDEEIVALNECCTILQRKLPQKLKDPSSFWIPCTIGKLAIGKALGDLRASINLMHLNILKKLGIKEVKPNMISFQIADRNVKYPYGFMEDLLVKVDKSKFPADFIVLNIEEDTKVPCILGRLFLNTGTTLIDEEQAELMLRVQDEK
jgi:hypothetical protein